MMKEIKAIVQPFMVEHVLNALAEHEGLPGVTVSKVIGWGRSRAAGARTPVHEHGHTFADKSKIEIVVDDALADWVVETISRAAHTGNPGDGKIFISDVCDVVKVRTGQRGKDAV